MRPPDGFIDFAPGTQYAQEVVDKLRPNRAAQIAEMVEADLHRKKTLATPMRPTVLSAVPEPDFDPWEMEGAPANRDSRGRILSPIVRDPNIDLP